MTERREISVGTPPDRYSVLVGPGAVKELPQVIGPAVRRVLLVHAPGVVQEWAERAAELLRAGGIVVHPQVLPDAEAGKTAAVAEQLWGVLGRADLTRSDAVVTVGGGAVSDLGGFVAATWLRGVRVVHVPTTLLGMVDAAVGGKTGINTAEGKNLVGAFHPPAAVLCDPSSLATLPLADLRAGLAEVVKAGFIADPVILELIEADPVAAQTWDSPVLAELIGRAIAVKARVVTEDLREASLREILNYGHTFGHAIEQVEGYRWRHGDAVSVGMVFAAELSAAAGHASAELVARHRSVLGSLDLPIGYQPGRWEALQAAMYRDKKTRADTLRFVILNDVAQPVRLEGPNPQWLKEAYARVGAGAPTVG